MPISEYLRKLREKVGNAPIMITAVTALIFNGAGCSIDPPTTSSAEA